MTPASTDALPVESLTVEEERDRAHYFVEIIAGASAGASSRIDQPMVLGSSADVDLMVNDSTVSRRHVQLERGPAGVWVRDLGSKNGTFLNGHRIQGLLVRREAIFTAGSTVFRVFATVPETQVRPTTFGDAVGKSESMQKVFEVLRRAAPTSSNLLLLGESGTGKDVLARAVHQKSPRRHRPFVVVDCASMAPNLIESELFGHAKGAFTGAHAERAGAFLSADGGTLFLDEIGELPLHLQPRLLRVLENRTLRRVGEDHDRRVDVRLIAATHRDLNEMRAAGTFREDLYFRLAVVVIHVPPLRQRKDDLPLLVDSILARSGRVGMPLSAELAAHLADHDWPGNIRELKNLIDRAFASDQSETGSEPAAPPLPVELPFKEAKDQLVESFTRSYFTRLFEFHRGNVTELARTAKIARTYASEMVKKLGLK